MKALPLGDEFEVVEVHVKDDACDQEEEKEEPQQAISLASSIRNFIGHIGRVFYGFRAKVRY
jgi:hypothetical protein